VLDPLGPLDLLRRPVIEIEEVPRRERSAAGDRAPAGRHLRASLDLRGDAARGAGHEGPDAGAGTDAVARSAAGDEAGAADGAPAPGSFEARLVAAGFETLPVDVWLGDGGVVRRLVVTVEAADTLTTTFDVYDVGADITIDTPDASEVVSPTPPANGSTGTASP
jgi:hypothetical protein